MNDKEVYLPIGVGRMLNIVVFLDEEKIYDGMIEEAPEQVKNLKYSKMSVGSQFIYYAYSEMQ